MIRSSNAQNQSLLIAAGSVVVSTAVIALICKRRSSSRTLKVPPGNEEEPTTTTPGNSVDCYYDVMVVGAGPAGATVSYYLGHANKQPQQQQQQPLNVLLVERKKFPRHKYCGDAWCNQALDILEDMEWSHDEFGEKVSVLQALEQDAKCRPVKKGGFVSPFGHECLNGEGDANNFGSIAQVKTYAIKRVIADEYVARAAQRQPGVELREETEVDVANVKYVAQEQCWHVPLKQSSSTTTPTTMIVKAKLLVACDGATSYLARHLGLVTKDADVICSHRYVVGGSERHKHNFTADGVMFFNRSILPGYSALFKHYNNDVYLGTYILPGGKATSRCIAGFEMDLVNRHPYVKSAFGGSTANNSNEKEDVYEATQWRVDLAQGENGKMKTAPIRCGGIPQSYGDHLIVIGDAAGQVDPMTGEGIHTAMVAAKLAAETIVEMFQARNLSASATQVYHQRWMNAFGNDFVYSDWGAKLIYWFPILLDAACAYGKERGGQAFLDEFGLIMTGVKPKSSFLQVKLALPISLYLVREIVHQYVLRRSPLIPQDIGTDLVDKYYNAQQQQQQRSK